MAKKFCPNHPTHPLFSKGVCIVCYRAKYAKPLVKTPIAPISTKQKNMLSVYRMLRRKYLREHPICQLRLRGCQGLATEIHHSAKKYTRQLWLDVTKYVACCSSCHRIVEDSPLIAKECGVYNYKISDDYKKIEDNIEETTEEELSEMFRSSGFL